jgi:Translation elongation factor Ts
MPRPISSPATSSSRASCARSPARRWIAGDIDALAAAPYGSEGKSVAEAMTQLIATIGENMTLRRMAKLKVGSGVVVGYVHNSQAPGLGKIGVLIGLESTGDAGKLAAFGKQLAMHVAAANPQSLDISSVDPAALERERNVLAEQARTSGKAEEIIAKMVEGRLRKYYEESCCWSRSMSSTARAG